MCPEHTPLHVHAHRHVHSHSACKLLGTSLHDHSERPSLVCPQHSLCALPALSKQRRNLRPSGVLMSAQGMAKVLTLEQGKPGFEFWLYYSLLYGLGQVNLPLCTLFPHTCRGDGTIKSSLGGGGGGAAVRMR